VADHWIRRAVRLRLDLQRFDAAQFSVYPLRCEQSGIAVTTMAGLGDTAEYREALYELDKTCAADIPGHGEFWTFDEYLGQRLRSPGCDPQGVVLAVRKGALIGMSATGLRLDEGCAVSEMTGVLPGYRGRGISIALKLRAIDYARSSGASWLVALHHPANAAAIAMNRRLGFVDYRPGTA
jgi:GNAT superfamily N-acetyltransferase